MKKPQLKDYKSKLIFGIISLVALFGIKAKTRAQNQSGYDTPQIKIETIIANKKSDFGRRGIYNPLDNSITLYQYELEDIPSAWRDKDLVGIQKQYNESLSFSLEHEKDHVRLEMISKFGFSSGQIIQFNIVREISAVLAEMLMARRGLVQTNDVDIAFAGLKSSYVVSDNYIDGYVNGIGLYYNWIKARSREGKINSIPDNEEINVLVTAAVKSFARRFPSGYIEDIAALSVRDMKLYDGLNQQKLGMTAEDFHKYLDKLNMGYVKVIALKTPVSFDDAVRTVFTHPFDDTEICLIERCDKATEKLLQESVLKMMNNRKFKKLCATYQFNDAAAEALRKQNGFVSVAYDFKPVKINFEYYFQGLGQYMGR